MNHLEIFENAVAAAKAAAAAKNADLGPEGARGFDCGFAWVVIPGTAPFAKWAKKNGHGHKNYPKGWAIWYSEFSAPMTQSVSVHYVAAKTFAQVLGEHGIECYADQRLD